MSFHTELSNVCYEFSVKSEHKEAEQLQNFRRLNTPPDVRRAANIYGDTSSVFSSKTNNQYNLPECLRVLNLVKAGAFRSVRCFCERASHKISKISG